MAQRKQNLSRRTVLKKSLAAASAMACASTLTLSASETPARSLRLGGPVFEKVETPAAWAAAVRKLGYGAAYCPVGPDASDELLKAYETAAKKADIVIAEVGAWSNPISPDDNTRRQALQKCRSHLSLADRIGAKCCVNITGSRGQQWDGPSPKNLTEETFDMIVETTRAIIDDVKPIRTYFTLETMPWAYPDSPDSYLRLLKTIDRKQFAVHLDPVNLICSPQRYFGNAALIRECFDKLGPHIKSCHAKDIILSKKLTTHLDEIRPGLGGLDYAVFLQELNKLSDVTLMLEHLSGEENYKLAADYIRTVAGKEGIPITR
ncbi:MAG: sugar phosphate isomerase/epimerase [Sedimentisphaerales bacterium]|nr:sugar phosphate isomerase/epimerase [Sedimentisphaerales bacterium]